VEIRYKSVVISGRAEGMTGGCKGLMSGAPFCLTLLCDKQMTAEGEHLGRSFKRSTLERGAIEGNSPVLKKTFMLLVRFLKYCRA